MARSQRERSKPSRRGRAPGPAPSGRRRLIAGLRVSTEDERLLALVAPLFPEADSAGDLAYRLWRRGLELTLAELASLSEASIAGLPEAQIATLAAQRVLLCLPLLQRTGMLAALPFVAYGAASPLGQPRASTPVEAIGEEAAAAVVSLGASEFL